MTTRRLSCGVVITDGARLLIGHATRTPRWDIPKGLAEPGESPVRAACRELREETSLLVEPDALRDLGTHRYLPGKDLALFLWRPPAWPNPAALRCASLVTLPGSRTFPELDRFDDPSWEEALGRVGTGMRRVLEAVRGGF